MFTLVAIGRLIVKTILHFGVWIGNLFVRYQWTRSATKGMYMGITIMLMQRVYTYFIRLVNVYLSIWDQMEAGKDAISFIPVAGSTAISQGIMFANTVFPLEEALRYCFYFVGIWTAIAMLKVPIGVVKMIKRFVP